MMNSKFVNLEDENKILEITLYLVLAAPRES